MRPPMMGDNFVRWQASTVPARVLAMLASTLPLETSANWTGIGLGRDIHQAMPPALASRRTMTRMRRMTRPCSWIRN